MSKLLTCVALSSLMSLVAVPASAVTQSWNGYKWSRTGPLAIEIGNNLNASWSSRFAPTTAQWSVANNIDFINAAGRSNAACSPIYGSVQVCNGNYGRNNWLGYANVWLSSGFIVQATVRLNDYYFNTAKYNTDAWRQMTICQEIGHTLGLAHTNSVRANLNTGSCMDYSNDPSGTVGGANGTLANLTPNSVDFAALDGIYATPDATQLSYTRPQFIAGDGFAIEDSNHGFGDHNHIDSFVAVPEPTSWAMLLLGFGGIGSMVRRQRTMAVAVAG